MRRYAHEHHAIDPFLENRPVTSFSFKNPF